MSIKFTTYKVTVSCQYMSVPSCYDIHMISFICSFCTFIYNKYVILLSFNINHHKTVLITQIWNQFLCDIL